MASLLPTIPRIIFSYVEPLSLVAGFLGPMVDPAWFVQQQIPQTGLVPALVNQNSIVVAQQLGNTYLLLAMLGIAILNTTSEIKVVRAYLTALLLGDIGHVALTAYGMGMEQLRNTSEWNATIWGNIAFTVFLCVARTSYFLGLFGPDKPMVANPKKTA